MNAAAVKEALDRGAQILRERERPPEKKSSQFRLSNALACVRRMYLLETGEAPAEELSAETLRIFQLGTDRGASMADALAAGLGDGWKCEPERAVSIFVEGQFVPGHIDVFAYGEGGEEALFEVKTMNPYAWKQLDEADPRSISDQYRAQLGCYWVGAGSEARVFFIAEDKATSQHKIVEVPRDVLYEGFDAGKANLAAGIRAVKEKRDPGRPHAPNANGELPWPCRYCSVADHCWEGKITKHSKSKWTVPT